jgi:hypothetical protein
VHRVDVPGLQRAGVQRPADARHGPREREPADVVGHGHEQQRGGAEQAGQHQDGAVPDGVGQPPVGSSSRRVTVP